MPNHGAENIHHSLKSSPHVKWRSNRGVAIQENISSIKSISNISTSSANPRITKLNNTKHSTTSAKNQTPSRKRTTTEPKRISERRLSSTRPNSPSHRNIIQTKGLIKQGGIPTRHTLKTLIINLPNSLNLSRLGTTTLINSRQPRSRPKGGALNRLRNPRLSPTTVTKSTNRKVRSNPPIRLNLARKNSSSSKRTTKNKIATMTTSRSPTTLTSRGRSQ